MQHQRQRILILCKTYPSPSAKHAETSCVAGMTEHGKLIRLYPVPFRLIGDESQFKKWQWITARVVKARNDHRPESHVISVDTIVCDVPPLPTSNQWKARREWLDKIPIYSNFADVEAQRQQFGRTLALLKPSDILGLDITPTKNPNWTEEEINKLTQLQQQGDLFEPAKASDVRLLRKLPFDFHYRYACDTAAGRVEYRHKLVDWEIGALFWKVKRSHGEQWAAPFADKLENRLPQSDLMFLMGTIHRFPDQWLIISLIYPPKRPPAEPVQGSLF